jgi:hypothetical protein
MNETKWYEQLLNNDKNLVILSVLVIACLAMVQMGVEAKDITINALTGLFGIAVGKSL